MKISTGSIVVAAIAAVALAIAGGCTDKGDGLLGTGPDDRVDRGGGPDTISVLASMDTYFERTFDKGSHLLAGSTNSIGLEAVTLLRFDKLPATDAELSSVELVLYSDTELLPSRDYDIRISRLEEPVPEQVPYWPGPPDGSDFIDIGNATTHEDTTSTGVPVYSLRVELPAAWVTGWINNEESNYGLRISGNSLHISGSGNVEPRFRSAGQVTEGSFSLSPRLETLRTDQTTADKWAATTSFFILKPTLDPVGDLPFMEMGGIFAYRILLRFQIPDSVEDGSVKKAFSLADASVNKALLKLKLDTSQPDLNQGVFDVVARAVVGGWRENSTNVNVEIDPASTLSVSVDAEEDTEIELDVTALVELFALSVRRMAVKPDTTFFDVAVLRTGEVPVLERAAVFSSETADSTDAPLLKLVFTTPPGGRYAP